MDVTNRAPYALIAFAWTRDGLTPIEKGPLFGQDTRIEPNSSAYIFGPPATKWEGNRTYVEVAGAVDCHDGLHCNDAYQVTKGKPLHWDNGLGGGVTVRHFEDERILPEL